MLFIPRRAEHPLKTQQVAEFLPVAEYLLAPAIHPLPPADAAQVTRDGDPNSLRHDVRASQSALPRHCSQLLFPVDCGVPQSDAARITGADVRPVWPLVLRVLHGPQQLQSRLLRLVGQFAAFPLETLQPAIHPSSPVHFPESPRMVAGCPAGHIGEFARRFGVVIPPHAFHAERLNMAVDSDRGDERFRFG